MNHDKINISDQTKHEIETLVKLSNELDIMLMIFNGVFQITVSDDQEINFNNVNNAIEYLKEMYFSNKRLKSIIEKEKNNT